MIRSNEPWRGEKSDLATYFQYYNIQHVKLSVKILRHAKKQEFMPHLYTHKEMCETILRKPRYWSSLLNKNIKFTLLYMLKELHETVDTKTKGKQTNVVSSNIFK
jgi:hypothetical protein